MELAEVVELGVAAFRGLTDSEDDVLVARLEALGLPAWLAARLVSWLPIAFGAQLLTGKVPEPEHASVDGAPCRLADDEVYRACRERARHMSRAEAQAIATRSAVVKVVDQVLTQTGKWPTEGEFVLSVGALPARDEATRLPSPTEAFRAFFEAHGLARSSERCQAYVFPVVSADRFRLQVDFVFNDERLPGGRVIESFGSVGGSWVDAITEAIRKFERGSLHVLIAGLVDRAACADQLTWETWADASGPREVCLGALLVLYNPIEVDVAPLLSALRELFRSLPRDDRAHTVRLYTARAGEQTFANEALLDGEPWPEALALVERHAWPTTSPLWGARLFLVIPPLE